ncbi:type II toxin-antitoxin system PemK/MazF family toxin [Candidatus Woesearchaeota archaeon]|nr:type II toxin-antitoxin system PemK/MazF family toxin [Candidatus Woesearchaeota archaeon]
MVKRGNIVLIKYPFTDLSGSKVRPALIITPDKMIPDMDDVLCLFISSVIPDELLDTDFIFDINNPAFKNSGLKVTSLFRTHKLALLNKSLVVRVLGELEPQIIKKINEKIKIAVGEYDPINLFFYSTAFLSKNTDFKKQANKDK